MILAHAELVAAVTVGAGSGGFMDKSSEYRQHAEECRVRARHAKNEEQRRQLLELAETWGSLAAERERMAEKRVGSVSPGGT